MESFFDPIFAGHWSEIDFQIIIENHRLQDALHDLILETEDEYACHNGCRFVADFMNYLIANHRENCVGNDGS